MQHTQHTMQHTQYNMHTHARTHTQRYTRVEDTACGRRQPIPSCGVNPHRNCKNNENENVVQGNLDKMTCQRINLYSHYMQASLCVYVLTFGCVFMQMLCVWNMCICTHACMHTHTHTSQTWTTNTLCRHIRNTHSRETDTRQALGTITYTVNTQEFSSCVYVHTQ